MFEGPGKSLFVEVVALVHSLMLTRTGMYLIVPVLDHAPYRPELHGTAWC
jgi:hypothetical protein